MDRFILYEFKKLWVPHKSEKIVLLINLLLCSLLCFLFYWVLIKFTINVRVSRAIGFYRSQNMRVTSARNQYMSTAGLACTWTEDCCSMATVAVANPHFPDIRSSKSASSRIGRENVAVSIQPHSASLMLSHNSYFLVFLSTCTSS